MFIVVIIDSSQPGLHSQLGGGSAKAKSGSQIETHIARPSPALSSCLQFVIVPAGVLLSQEEDIHIHMMEVVDMSGVVCDDIVSAGGKVQGQTGHRRVL